MPVLKEEKQRLKNGDLKKVRNDIGRIKIGFVTLFSAQRKAWLFERLNMVEIIEKEWRESIIQNI